MEETRNTKEIDIVKIAKIVLRRWRLLMRFAIAGAIIGVIIAFSIPKTYCSSVLLAPEFSSGTASLSSSLSELASSFGVNIGNANSSMDAIYPDLYPDIFESTEFIESLYDVPVRLQDDDRVRTYINHIKKDLRMAWWDYPKSWLSRLLKKPEPLTANGKNGANPYAMNRTQWELYKIVSLGITCLVDKKTSVITISVCDQDPMVAAIMADTLQRRLQAYITDYRTKKARTDYEYYDKLMKEAESKYKEKQSKYVGFSDSHRNSVLQSVNVHEQSLQSKMSSAYEVYATMSKMRDQAKAKIQERTPAFTMIQSAKMPYKASSRSRLATLLIFILLGCIADAAWITFIRKYFRKTKKE